MERLAKPGRGNHLAIVEVRPDAVPLAVERRKHALGDAGGLLQDGGGVGFVHGVEAKHVMQQPGGFGGRCGNAHGSVLQFFPS
jgi:hypothetical protein